jgi:hypothetical protein
MSTTKNTAPGTMEQHRHQAIDTRNAAYKSVLEEERARADRLGLGDRQRQVYEALVEAGPEGATNDELSEALNVPANALTPRMYELRGLGDENPLNGAPLAFPLRRDGRRVTRPTRTGTSAQVWVAKPYVDVSAEAEVFSVSGSGRLEELVRVVVEE